MSASNPATDQRQQTSTAIGSITPERAAAVKAV